MNREYNIKNSVIGPGGSIYIIQNKVFILIVLGLHSRVIDFFQVLVT